MPTQNTKTRSALHDVVTREYTIHLHKRVHDLAFKKSTSKRSSLYHVYYPCRHLTRRRFSSPRPFSQPDADPLIESPHAIKAVVIFAQKTMGVKDVRISPGLNQAIWSRGIKSPPKRIRVRLERKRNDDEGAKEKLYVLASVVEGVTSFKVGGSRVFAVQNGRPLIYE